MGAPRVEDVRARQRLQRVVLEAVGGAAAAAAEVEVLEQARGHPLVVQPLVLVAEGVVDLGQADSDRSDQELWNKEGFVRGEQ